MRSRVIAYSFMILLLAAHFSRANNGFLAILTLLIPLLLFIRKGWVIYTLQIVGYLGAVVWIVSGYQYVQLRIAAGDDWIRLMLIIGAIAIYSSGSAYFLRSERVKEIYGILK